MKHLLHSILLLIFLFGVSIPAFACPVCTKMSLAEETEKTDFVFVGQVIEIKEDKDYIPPKAESVELERINELLGENKRYFVKFKVTKKIKVLESDEFILVDYKAENVIRFSDHPLYEKGKTYLIYANKNKNSEGKEEIRDNGICSRTRLLNKELKNNRKSKKILEKS